MNILDNVTTVEEATLRLLSTPYALSYNSSDLAKKFVDGTSEEVMIALQLCGIAGEELALDFMNGSSSAVVPFLDNVSYNGESSIPLILRAINLRLLS